jgi:hypothetical protein
MVDQSHNFNHNLIFLLLDYLIKKGILTQKIHKLEKNKIPIYNLG